MPLARTPGDRVKAIAAVSLAFAAGCVDIIGYIRLGHVFTAHLTGNTVRLGEGLFDGHWGQAIKAGTVIAAFFCGSVAGRAMIEVGARKRLRSVATLTLLAEAVLIAAVAFSHGKGFLWTALLAVAMGIQTATLTRIGPLTVHTTFVTGMLNKLAQLISHLSFLTYDAMRGAKISPGTRGAIAGKAAFMFSVWLCYVVGAVFGTATRMRWDLLALLVPAFVCGLLIAVDQISPLSVEEEKDQSER